MTMNTELPVLKAKDYASDQEIRWCPGCGDYAILNAVKKTLAKIQAQRENSVFVSGIGCSSRFPYYMNTNGFHSIHGRAPAFAAGIKGVRPDLDVWMVSGDGDGFSIGLNHTLHFLRRNFNVNFLLFNNRIYGLTKGQASPTSEQGKFTKSTPMGSLETPFRPVALALAADATFVARGIDTDKVLTDLIETAAEHKGTSFVEIYQNCNIFNDGAFAYSKDKDKKADNTLYLKHGEPMIFGKDEDKGLRWHNGRLEVVEIAEVGEEAILKHDQTDLILAKALSQLSYPDYPEPMGVFFKSERPVFEEQMQAQVDYAIEQRGEPSLDDLFNMGDTYEIQ